MECVAAAMVAPVVGKAWAIVSLMTKTLAVRALDSVRTFFIGFPVEIAACFGRAEYKSKQNLTNTRVSMEFIDGVNIC